MGLQLIKVILLQRYATAAFFIVSSISIKSLDGEGLIRDCWGAAAVDFLRMAVIDNQLILFVNYESAIHAMHYPS
jgi:hypothetical protein